MIRSLQVTYFHNSGFMVRTGDTLLIFDYWTGENQCLPVESRLTEKDLSSASTILFFVSHAHPDHFDPVIYNFNFNRLPITYIVSDDLPIGTRGRRIHEGETMAVGTVVIRAFGSTDTGVSFYVSVNGLNIFHAGDLNFWHWREESSLRQVREAEESFYKCMAPIEKLPIDLAMFPLDPRQGSFYDAGANHFIMSAKPRVFIPMHWQGKTAVPQDFCRRGRTRYTQVVALTQARESASLDYEDTTLSVRVIPPLEPYTRAPGRGEVHLDKLTRDDPFSETDLPVNI